MQAQLRLWEFRWLRDLVALVVVALVLIALYRVRHVVAPILLGAALAYVFNPLLTWAQKHKVPRWAGAAMLIALAVLAGATLFATLGTVLVSQAYDLTLKLPDYLQSISHRLGYEIDWQALWRQAQARSTDATSYAQPVAGAAARIVAGLVAVILAVVNFVTYATMAGVVVALTFFFFAWRWSAILRWFEPFIPASSRDKTLHVLRRMDRSVSAFIRGRLVQALVMGLILCVGWKLAGVPYWLLLGLGTGLLNLVPFAGIVGFIVALTLAMVDHLSGGGTWAWGVVVWPAAVYLLAQAIDSWVVEPMVQGQATDLDPLTVLLAVLIGGALAGLLGLLLAIPVTACLKILSQELLLPRLRQLAAEN